jgi:pimeloyl-ACP methyl ester carboxylesterase
MNFPANRAFDAPVAGGLLHGGIWGADASPPVLAIHGITASHLAWATVARALPEHRLIAPDLRGRGASATLPGPWGMARHADDVVAALDHLGVEKAQIVGHSMGAFVAAVVARRHPDRVSSLLLADGGLPLELPPGVTLDDLDRTLGPAAERLGMTFASPEAYRAFWRSHPAFAEHAPAELDAYVDYDLASVAGELKSRTSADAMRYDSRELYGGDIVIDALEALGGAILLTAPRGLQNEKPGLYPPEVLARWQQRVPELTILEVEHVNHYTIVMGERGAATVAGVIRSQRASLQVEDGH